MELAEKEAAAALADEEVSPRQPTYIAGAPALGSFAGSFLLAVLTHTGAGGDGAGGAQEGGGAGTARGLLADQVR
jgi:hypothetical protein